LGNEAVIDKNDGSEHRWWGQSVTAVNKFSQSVLEVVLVETLNHAQSINLYSKVLLTEVFRYIESILRPFLSLSFSCHRCILSHFDILCSKSVLFTLCHVIMSVCAMLLR